ncbi:heparinase II/III family protein [Chitinophaga sp. MM2321]|uniref:heparinase II/III domain-containing protein n=1 Tax=Chitinophaga sp. MM2321 TaxID=3137178 RepID=UPI0032D577CD
MRYLFLSASCLFLLAGTLFTCTPANATGTEDSLLAGLRQEHPRLLATAADFKRIAQERETDAYVKTAFQKIYQQGEEIIKAAPSIYEIPDGKRLLATSRRVVDRVSILGFLYRTTGEERFAARAWQELLPASRFPDWNPSHFLDVGEMTFAFALGYDWLYDYWNKDQRHIIKSALMEKGLSRALLAYEGLAVRENSWWINVPHNWNQVCNGGIGVGALAIADEEPKLATAILKNVLQHLPTAMKHFAPDGAWNEGPGYWNYATRYNVAIIAALKSALDKDFGLNEIDGFSKTGLFPLYLNSPINRSFNYADGGDGPIRGAQLFWFAKQFQQPEVAQYLYHFQPADPFALLWYDASLVKTSPQLQPDHYFRIAEVVTMRSRWNDSTATFVTFKAGDNKANHSHLDLGSFILDALGQRWIVDLGADDYNMPGYFNSSKNGQRWTYYRTRAEGHNTLVIAPGAAPDQDPLANTQVVDFTSQPSAAYAIMDLTPAYAAQSSAVKRGIALLKKSNSVVVQDEITNLTPADVYWFAHSRAAIKLDARKRSATLEQNGRQFIATLVSPANATFSVMPAAPLPGSPHPAQNNPNKGIQKLAVHLPATTSTRIVVVFHPAGVKTGSAFTRPLAQWK